MLYQVEIECEAIERRWEFVVESEDADTPGSTPDVLVRWVNRTLAPLYSGNGELAVTVYAFRPTEIKAVGTLTSVQAGCTWQLATWTVPS